MGEAYAKKKKNDKEKTNHLNKLKEESTVSYQSWQCIHENVLSW